MLAANGIAMSRFRGDRGFETVLSRTQSVNQRVAPNDLVLRLMHLVVQPGGLGTLTWKRDVAKATLAAWQHGGHVWASRRLLASTPAPEWRWVEGDDYRVKWSDISAFFQQLDLLDPFGGADGFAELARSRKNQRWLQGAMGVQ
jgi:hypothetical protein